MTTWLLENERFQIIVRATGGELAAVKDKNQDREWLWQPQPGLWNNSATQLFPVVGRLIHDGVWVEGEFLPLPAHGFLRQQVFTCVKHETDKLLIEARSTAETLQCWPWKWRIQLHLTLHSDGISVIQRVINDDERAFWYSIGWHPGFALPVAKQTGWRVNFGKGSVKGFFPTQDRTLSVSGNAPEIENFLLTQESFKAGAIYFSQCQNQFIAVHSPDGRKVMSLEMGAQEWLALWGIPGTDLLCIEPLAGTTDAPDFNGRLDSKRGVQRIEAGTEQEWSVRLRFAVDA
jgi:galactose mutarotase-like enzyme